MPAFHRGGACPKFNIASLEELNNFQVAQLIADTYGRVLNYEMVDPNLGSRPGHDFRYLISGDYVRSLGWAPKFSVRKRLAEVVTWTKDRHND